MKKGKALEKKVLPFLSPQITRRDFLKGSIAFCVGLFGANLLDRFLKSEKICAAVGFAKEALYYKNIDKNTVACLLCPRQCVLKNGERSFCRVREAKDGKLYTLVYEFPCAIHIDPIEKKPLYHFLPGSKSFSIATAGCNLRCKFCQNWQISQECPENTVNRYLSCADVVNSAIKSDCRSIAYTYSEPNVFYEYMLATSKIAKANNIKNLWITAGFINPDPLEELCKVINAANIDLKGFSDKYLDEICGERLEPLLNTIRIAKEKGVWVEITNLIVPTLNDDMVMIRDMCSWIKQSLGPDTPLHFSRFWPMYKLKNLPPTPLKTLQNAFEVAKNTGLNFVYVGNVPDGPVNNTECPQCKKIIIRRAGYFILENNVIKSNCKFCGRNIPGIWA